MLAINTTCCTIIILGLSTILTSSSYAQSLQDSTRYRAYDSLVSKDNSALYNGPQFKDEELYAWDNSHIYLESSLYKKNFVGYRGQMYFDVPLRYDIYHDLVTIRSDDHLSLFKVQLIPEFTSTFSLQGRTFLRIPDTGLELEGNGFFERIQTDSSFCLFLKHVKKKKRETVKTALQYYFETDNYYLLNYNDTFYRVATAKDFKDSFPNKYKPIRSFYKENKALLKENPNRFMIKLAGEFFSKNNTETDVR